MKFLSNLHMHTLYCDGNNSVEEYIKKAIELNFISIGFSGHSYISGEIGNDWCMSEEGTYNYIKEIKNLRKKYKDKIEIYLGLEIDYLSNYTKDIKDKFFLDYTIGSVHLINNSDGNYYSIDTSPEETEIGIKAFGGIKNYIKVYYDTLLKMILEQEPDIIGHIDLVQKFNKNNKYFDENEQWYIHILDNVLNEIKKTSCIIEINTGAISRGWTDFPYPSKRILNEILKKDIPITINSDAHSIENINFFFDKTLDIIKKIGFKKIKILNDNNFNDLIINI